MLGAAVGDEAMFPHPIPDSGWIPVDQNPDLAQGQPWSRQCFRYFRSIAGFSGPGRTGNCERMFAAVLLLERPYEGYDSGTLSTRLTIATLAARTHRNANPAAIRTRPNRAELLSAGPSSMLAETSENAAAAAPSHPIQAGSTPRRTATSEQAPISGASGTAIAGPPARYESTRTACCVASSPATAGSARVLNRRAESSRNAAAVTPPARASAGSPPPSGSTRRISART